MKTLFANNDATTGHYVIMSPSHSAFYSFKLMNCVGLLAGPGTVESSINRKEERF